LVIVYNISCIDMLIHIAPISCQLQLLD
jgi:hypothetical protein